MAAIMTWWRKLSPRERLLVALMLFMLVAVIGWLGIARPLAMARDDAQTRQMTAQTALDDINRMAVEIRAARAARRTGPDLPLLEHVRASADAAGMTVERLEKTADGGVSLRIPAVRSTALLGWLAVLEGDEGLVVERLSVARNDDESLAVDLFVSARAR